MGRWACSSVGKCEEYQAIDLAWLRRKGILDLGRRDTLTWSRGGQQTGSIGVLAGLHGLQLIYRTRTGDGDWQDVDELVPFMWTPTRFGGRRQWFKCLKCANACRVLYGGSRFRCRRCYRLRYNSQYAPSYQRATEEADKLRKRVGGDYGAFKGDVFPPKPKGMHWQTYRRLEQRYDNLQKAGAIAAMAKFGLSFDDGDFG